MPFIIFDLSIGKYKTLSLKKKGADLNQNADKGFLRSQASSNNQEILIESELDPVLNASVKNPRLSSKLPDSLILKSFILLLSLIFTPLGLALALALTAFVVALILAILIVLTVFALILAPLKLIIRCFHPKETISLDCLDQKNSIRETNEPNEIIPLLFKNENIAKNSFFTQQQEANFFVETSTEKKHYSTAFDYRKK